VTRTQRFELRLTADEMRHLDACAASLGIGMSFGRRGGR